MSKIGIDARMYGKAQSGIGNYIKQLSAEIFLLDKENEYYLFLLEPIFSQYQAPHEKIHKIRVTSSWYSLAEQTKFLREINKYKLDLMHFPHFNAPIFYNRPRLATIHDIIPHFFPGHKQKTWYRKKAYELVLRSNLKKSAKIITISQATKNDLMKFYNLPADKVPVVYLGIEAHFIKSENYAKIEELKQRLKITKPYIFFLSAWRNHKNFEGLIKAFEIIKKEAAIDCQLVLGGQEDPYYPDISQTIKKSPNQEDIITPGFISDEDLPLYYNAAELVAIPSFYEGFGLIGLEAMACGTPVASSNATSLPEIYGDAALYFDPHDPNDMAEKIKQLLIDKNLKEDLIRKGTEQLKKYSWQKCAQQTLGIYQQILQANRAK
ncbi:MAG: glycosyltransferase family 1 protein [Candidatus Parcubacteria bacterium]|nr:glycosyltransferase family 1 protein [Candidatus Parcubacteria bacterium]